MKKIIFAVILTAGLISFAEAGPFADIETGAAFTGYNDVGIPGKYGTRFSLTGVLKAEPTYVVRARVGWFFLNRHTISVLAAPLKFEATGRASRYIFFHHAVFPAGLKLKAQYKFNSFRLTYRFDIVARENIRFGIGLTGKIRDAYTRLETLGMKRTREDLGFVPLVNIRLWWMFVKDWSFVLDIDALASPQGRAEDVLAAFQYHVNKHVTLRAGYRILEGGADNKSVYTFTMVHYATVGATFEY